MPATPSCAPGWPTTRPCAARSCASYGSAARCRPGRSRTGPRPTGSPAAGPRAATSTACSTSSGPRAASWSPAARASSGSGTWPSAAFPAWAPTRRPPEREVVRLATQRSLRALGVATARDIDRSFTAGRYPGLSSVLAGLQRSGQVEQVRLADNGTERPGPWYVHADDLALLERLQSGDWQPRTTLLSPFDNLIINRERTERLFGFQFRLEIYVPKAARRYGYYVLPILHGDQLVGRVDPALDRTAGRLVVNAIHAEPDAPASAGPAVATALQELAAFLGATGVDLRQPPPQVWRTGFA